MRALTQLWPMRSLWTVLCRVTWVGFTSPSPNPSFLARVQAGVSVAELGERCANKQIRNVVQALGWFCRRYRLDRRPEHSTETSVVYLATEFMPDNRNGKRVAIKFMSDKTQYDSEIALREGLDTRFVCKRLATHCQTHE